MIRPHCMLALVILARSDLPMSDPPGMPCELEVLVPSPAVEKHRSVKLAPTHAVPSDTQAAT